MLFNSYEFLFVFLPVCLLGYYVLGGYSERAVLAWLVTASLFFYGWWDPRYLGLIAFSIGANFLIGEQLRRHGRTGSRGAATALLYGGVALNLALIGYFKYADMLLSTGGALLGVDGLRLDLVLPIGISFFTFQQIAYLVDTSRGRSARPRLLEYCFFVSFFPQLIAGPIVQFRDIFPQLRHMRANYRALCSNLAIGLTIFAIGLFKKVIIADELAPIANEAFDRAAAGGDLGATVAWRGVFAYSLQIYFDFSGYSDMAIGLAHMFGFRLPLNFNSPYKASSVIDFWRRWHMTLSRFLRDYLYIPLGGNRHGPARRHVNLMITMLLGGLWHGASWTFVAWGGLHGAYLIANHAFRRAGVTLGRGVSGATAGRILTFTLVSIAWVFFRADTFASAQAMLGGMLNLPRDFAQLPFAAPVLSAVGFRFEGSPWQPADTKYALCLLAWLGFLWYAPSTQQYVGYAGTSVRRVSTAVSGRRIWRRGFAHAVAAGILLAGAVTGLSRISEFIYFQF